MKISKTMKKTIFGFVGVILAGVIFLGEAMTNVTDVTATTKVFDGITQKYSTTNQVRILEITSSSESVRITYPQMQEHYWDNANLKAELGYFMPFSTRKFANGTVENVEGVADYDAGNNNSSPEEVGYASRGLALGDPRSKTKAELLLNYRQYGLIKAIGMDAGWNTKIGENPIYSNMSVFSIISKENQNNEELKAHFVKGVYSLVEAGKGEYYLDPDKYTLNDNHEICTITKSVSVNDLGQEETIVSINSVVSDVNTAILGLPESSTTGEKYITHVGADAGNLSFEESVVATNFKEYYGYGSNSIWYTTNARYKNSDWFSEYVLGSNKTYKDTNADYTVKCASDVKASEIADYDLIYISGTSAEYATAQKDISEDVMLELYHQELNNHKAIMMDYALYSADSSSNLSKLAALLWQKSQSDLYTEHGEKLYDVTKVGTETVYTIHGNDGLKEGQIGYDSVIDDLKKTILTNGNGNFVTGNVYVYNHHMADFDNPKSMVDALDMFANGDFNTPYTSTVATDGFNNVLAYINATNKNSLTGSMPAHVTPAVAIQYILVSDGEALTVMKADLNVLEIQPVSAFLYNETRGSEEYGYLADGSEVKKNRDDFVSKYLSNYYADKAKYVSFTSMTIDEFNGRNEDLIETYDVIFIGSETGNLYYTGKLTTRKKENGVYTDNYDTNAVLPDYLDNNMDGMVYYNIGDKIVDNNSNAQGWLDDNSNQFRFAGRDLTKNKLTKLQAYLAAKKPILVAGDLVAQRNGSSVINPTAILESIAIKDENGNITGYKEIPKDGCDVGRIDNASNMYELMQYALGYQYNKETGGYENKKGTTAYPTYPNLISMGDIDAGLVDKTVLNTYVATEKLQLMLTSAPEEYVYGTQPGTQIIDEDTIVYLKEEANGARKLKYEFSILSDEVGESYTPHLYIDINNDGKFSTTTEDIRDVQIVVKASGEEVKRDENNNYVLYSGVNYQMTRDLDDSYSGYLKWKLSVQANVNTNAHASEEGSTLVENKDEVKAIHILQINRNVWDTLNLETESTSATSKYKKYLDAVPGYEVIIKTVTVDQFMRDFYAKYKAQTELGLEEYSHKYFNEYQIQAPTATNPTGVIGVNMLVLGFGDDFSAMEDPGTKDVPGDPEMGQSAIKAVKYFMESEKPVLLTHDFITFRSSANQARYLRDTVGMDRYGVTCNVTKETLSDGSVVAKLQNRYMATGGESYLYEGKAAYSRDVADDKAVMKLIESTGKTVAYQPGLGRQSILRNTQGMSNGTMMRWIDNTENNPVASRRKWLNSKNVTSYYGAATYTVEKMNEGQITSYPYDLPDSFGVSKTHAQYFQLDFDADDDKDGETDVVVWYTLGNLTGGLENTTKPSNYTDKQWQEREWDKDIGLDHNPYSDSNAGPSPVDAFYIYNKGNITYTGAGHSSMVNAPDEEVQLFINTLFAAYNAGKTVPSAGFFETAPDADDEPITSIAVPYDENVTGGNPIDSSVLKKADGTYRYQFVNPNASGYQLANGADLTKATPIFYRLSDTNFVRGEKYIQVEYYLEAKGSRVKKDATGKIVGYQTDNGRDLTTTTITVDGAAIPVVDISDQIATFRVENGSITSLITPSATTSRLMDMQSGSVYAFYLPMTYLNEDSNFTIYIKTKTRVYTASSLTGDKTYEEVPGEGYSSLTVTKTDLLDLD